MTAEFFKASWNGHSFKKIRGRWYPMRERQLEMFSPEDMGPPRVTKKIPRNEPKTSNPPNDLYTNWRP